MTFLCIDDDADDVELFQDAMKMIDGNSKFVLATNGIEALSVLATLTPDYIFLDINMPVMDGKETLKNIRTNDRFRSIPVCILTTSNDQREAQVYKTLGATKFLVKPDSLKELVSTLKTVIGEVGK